MKNKELSLKDLDKTYPKSGKIDLQNFSEKDKEEYLALYNLYRKLFTEYITERLNLKAYDEKLSDSEYGFSPTDERKMDVYQYFSSDVLRYFYIRNNIYIEKLTKKEADFFRRKITEGDFGLDPEAKKMIESTYPKVIFEDLLQDGKKYRVLFGPDSSSFFADNDNIVIGIRYNEFSKDGLDDNSWFNRLMAQKKFLNETINEMNEAFEEMIPGGITIIKYNDVSIIPREEEKKINSKGEER